MLVINVEIWPFGDQSQAKHLGTMLIANDVSGTEQSGNYKVKIYKRNHIPLNFISTKYVLRTSEVKGFARKRLSVWALICKALIAAKYK